MKFTRNRTIALAVGIGLFLVAFGVAMAVSWIQGTRVVPATLNLQSTVVKSGDQLFDLWWDDDMTRPVERINWFAVRTQPVDGLREMVRVSPRRVVIHNKSDYHLRPIAPCAKFQISGRNAHVNAGLSTMPVKDEKPDSRGDACQEDWSSDWWMAPGEKWQMHLSVDFHNTVVPGDYHFDVVVGVMGVKSDPQQPASKKFDFNSFIAPTGDTPTMAGYIGVKSSDIFDATKGYGWNVSVCCAWHTTPGPAQMVDLLRDAHQGDGQTGDAGSRVFLVKVEPNAQYKVLLHFYSGTDLDQISVFNADAAQEGVTQIAIMANTHVQKEFNMNSGQDGIVKLKIRDNGGQNGVADGISWIINGLEVTRQ